MVTASTLSAVSLWLLLLVSYIQTFIWILFADTNRLQIHISAAPSYNFTESFFINPLEVPGVRKWGIVVRVGEGVVMRHYSESTNSRHVDGVPFLASWRPCTEFTNLLPVVLFILSKPAHSTPQHWNVMDLVFTLEPNLPWPQPFPYLQHHPPSLLPST